MAVAGLILTLELTPSSASTCTGPTFIAIAATLLTLLPILGTLLTMLTILHLVLGPLQAWVCLCTTCPCCF